MADNHDSLPTLASDPNDAFLDVAARIKIDDVRALLDSKLINPKDAAARFYALSLALDPDDAEIYYAINEYDGHPEIVSVVIEMGKTDSMSNMNLVKSWGLSLDDALCRAAEECNSEAMKILGRWGARDNNAFRKAAGKGRLEAMKRLKSLGGRSRYYDTALSDAAANGHVEAMQLLKDWGATDFEWALCVAAREGHIPAMKILKSWGAKRYDWAITMCRNEGARSLILDWLLGRI